MPYCTNCGHDNPEGSNFCGQCGTPLTSVTAPVVDRTSASDTTKTMPAAIDDRDGESLTAEDEAAVKALPRGSALLVVRRGSNAGSRYLLNTDVVTAGRHQDSDIFLDDISVSRRHAEFTRSAEGITIKDLGSLNGTYVNRELVEQRLLAQGDEVQIGKFRLVFFTGQDTA
ncbi:FHA domain-containing protein [Microlunatus parietis]|uniref:FHA domain-containing protein n=1 Tax=Microlunatus parietis TaxID=682979 RepID=UPI0015CE44AD|nr:FHA domain-containing protein [Microlunatus parietis]